MLYIVLYKTPAQVKWNICAMCVTYMAHIWNINGIGLHIRDIYITYEVFFFSHVYMYVGMYVAIYVAICVSINIAICAPYMYHMWPINGMSYIYGPYIKLKYYWSTYMWHVVTYDDIYVTYRRFFIFFTCLHIRYHIYCHMRFDKNCHICHINGSIYAT